MKTIKNKGGRPKYQVTPEHTTIVEKWAAAGVIQEKIARRIGISVDTLHKYYKDVWEMAADETVVEVAGALITSAKAGNVQAAKFFLSCRAGWVDVSRQEVTGKDGGPVEVSEHKARMMSVVEQLEKQEKMSDAEDVEQE